MDRNCIRASILSLGAPATSIGQDKTEIASFCREINEYAAALRAQHPSRFGFFATLPSLDDIEACVTEIRYALQTLKAEGINILTSYGGKYLGHPAFRPVWEELNAHSAVVFVHPGIDSSLGPIKEPSFLPAPIFDWTHETTRAAAHLIMTDTLKKHPACKIVLSHGGGTLPYVANRIAHLGAAFQLMNKSSKEFLNEARGFYFDVAFAGYDGPLPLLLEFAKPGHVLYGSDYPFGTDSIIEPQLQNIDTIIEGRTDAAMITQDAARVLFPRLGCAAD